MPTICSELNFKYYQARNKHGSQVAVGFRLADQNSRRPFLCAIDRLVFHYIGAFAPAHGTLKLMNVVGTMSRTKSTVHPV